MMIKMNDNTKAGEKRSESRLNDEIIVFIETYSSPQSERQFANMVISKTIDLSANGFQVLMDNPLPLNSILRVCLETANHPQPFILAGEVIRQSGTVLPGQYSIGFQLLESEQTDIAEWKKYIAQRLAEEN
jgi:hypothetical protein